MTCLPASPRKHPHRLWTQKTCHRGNPSSSVWNVLLAVPAVRPASTIACGGPFRATKQQRFTETQFYLFPKFVELFMFFSNTAHVPNFYYQVKFLPGIPPPGKANSARIWAFGVSGYCAMIEVVNSSHIQPAWEVWLSDFFTTLKGTWLVTIQGLTNETGYETTRMDYHGLQVWKIFRLKQISSFSTCRYAIAGNRDQWCEHELGQVYFPQTLPSICPDIPLSCLRNLVHFLEPCRCMMRVEGFYVWVQRCC